MNSRCLQRTFPVARLRIRTASLACAVAFVVSASPRSAVQQEPDYRIGIQDVLEINMFNQEDLSGHYTVETDGAFSFPLIGRIAAAGLTVQEFEEALRKRLQAGYFRNPRITVAVAEYRSLRVFVLGEVRNPGPYPLDAGTSLIEVLALAGSVTTLASGTAVIVRGDGQAPKGDPAQALESTETVRVNLRTLESGDLSRNILLRDGDTIFVPRAEVVYVFGEVRAPGSYPIQDGMTVLQALSLAGGSTEFAALNRISVMRIVDGKQQEFRVRLDNLVRGDDTLLVPVKFF